MRTHGTMSKNPGAGHAPGWAVAQPAIIRRMLLLKDAKRIHLRAGSGGRV